MEMLLVIPASTLLVPNDIQPNVTDNTEDTYSSLLGWMFCSVLVAFQASQLCLEGCTQQTFTNHVSCRNLK
jgi:hypothetical protein